ncbi:uncharacterized protein LOC113291422 [Papaver somniferum]|uniref:uncharacterized protein LOC113291422 n=1 Tax=Papaver somniferum TaxID=3469 RepID=UPI000E6FA5B5|nr:uncharacterized protein LOC113291422 [Papaver somniferum]
MTPIIILQETKMMQCTSFDVMQICGNSKFGWTFLQFVGSSEGMLIHWYNDFLEVTDSLVGDYTLPISCVNKFDDFAWALTNVYGPKNPIDRDDFWVELDNACSYWDLPWCIGGDFNTVKTCVEKKNCTKLSVYQFTYP